MFKYSLIYSIYFLVFCLRGISVSKCGDKPLPQGHVPGVCRILCSSVWSLSRNLSYLAELSSQNDLLLCFETLISYRRHISELLVNGFGRSVLFCRDMMPWARGMAAYVRDGYGPFRQPKIECGCCEVLVFRICGARQNYVFSLYCNPHLDDRINE